MPYPKKLSGKQKTPHSANPRGNWLLKTDGFEEGEGKVISKHDSALKRMLGETLRNSDARC